MQPGLNPTQTEEARLVEGCLEGSRTHQEAFYKRFASKMFGVVLRYANDRDTAADVLQDGFVTCFQRLHQFRGDGSLEGWVRRVMVTTAISHCRRQMRNPEQADLETAAAAPSPDANALGVMAAEELLALVQELPVGFRTVFNLYAIEGYSHQEIADALGISVGTSKSQLNRARESLKKRLQTLYPHAYESAMAAL